MSFRRKSSTSPTLQHSSPRQQQQQSLPSSSPTRQQQNSTLSLLALNHHDNMVENQIANEVTDAKFMRKKHQTHNQQQQNFLKALPDFYSSAVSPTTSRGMMNNNSTSGYKNAPGGSPQNRSLAEAGKTGSSLVSFKLGSGSEDNSNRTARRPSISPLVLPQQDGSNKSSSPLNSPAILPSSSSSSLNKTKVPNRSHQTSSMMMKLPPALLDENEERSGRDLMMRRQTPTTNNATNSNNKLQNAPMSFQQKKNSSSSYSNIHQRASTPTLSTKPKLKRTKLPEHDDEPKISTWSRLSRPDPLTEERMKTLRQEVLNKECTFTPRLSKRTKAGTHARIGDIENGDKSVNDDTDDDGLFSNTRAVTRAGTAVSRKQQRTSTPPVRSNYSSFFSEKSLQGTNRGKNSNLAQFLPADEDPDLAGVGPPPEDNDDNDDNNNNSPGLEHVHHSSSNQFSNDDFNNNNSMLMSKSNIDFQSSFIGGGSNLRSENSLNQQQQTRKRSGVINNYDDGNQNYNNNNDGVDAEELEQQRREDPLRRKGIDNPSFKILRKNVELAASASAAAIDRRTFKPKVSKKAQKLFSQRDSVAESFRWKAGMMEKHEELIEKHERDEEKKFLDTCSFEPQVDYHSDYLVQSMGDRRMTVQDQALMTARQKAEEAIQEMAVREFEKQKDLKYLEQQRLKMQLYEKAENQRKQAEMMREEESSTSRVSNPAAHEATVSAAQKGKKGGNNSAGVPASQMKIHDLRRQWMQAVFSM